MKNPKFIIRSSLYNSPGRIYFHFAKFDLRHTVAFRESKWKRVQNHKHKSSTKANLDEKFFSLASLSNSNIKC